MTHPNPFDFGRTMLETWEKTMGEALEKLTHDEAFLKNMSQALGGSLDLKKQMESQVERYLQSINMPTRSDLERILAYLQRIESRLLDLEDRLDLLGAPAATPATPAASPARRATPRSTGTAAATSQTKARPKAAATKAKPTAARRAK
ncbi:MAG: hypothetical protein OZSIB_1172 [Candidatus Ozemobacter sibiricus]|jgi:hypothetical protein|uniref:Poly(3-hydroxyalkanoate) polymerase subunit PhaE n=1 Tax=Candidatus Ozemobacter sibiricus TaxID=2268124 RepID=A0A367ZKL9_9BACT|nr:MAG: hypothetical protein OZSIB_1172 [Candidatus Ozemobacter sibiricus]